MNPDSPSFSQILDQELMPYDYNEFAMAALLGCPSTDQADGIFYQDSTLCHLNLHGFPEEYQVPVNVVASPGSLSSPSLPPSPFSLADDLSDPGFMDLSSPYSPSPPPTEPSDLFPVANMGAAMPEKGEHPGFERNPISRKLVCTKCPATFVSTHEARRHAKTAAACTGKKALCLRCNDHIHASKYSQKRHFGSKKCQKKGRKKGAVTYTINNAFIEL